MLRQRDIVRIRIKIYHRNNKQWTRLRLLPLIEHNLPERPIYSFAGYQGQISPRRKYGTNRRPQNQGPKRVVDYYQSRSLKRTFVIVEEIGERWPTGGRHSRLKCFLIPFKPFDLIVNNKYRLWVKGRLIVIRFNRLNIMKNPDFLGSDSNFDTGTTNTGTVLKSKYSIWLTSH